MKVYIAEIVWHYDGAEVIGVYTSRERAEQEGEKMRKCYWCDGVEYLRGDELLVTEWEVEV